MLKAKLIYFPVAALMLASLSSCVDDDLQLEPPSMEEFVDPTLPDEIRNGYSISFNMALGPVGGESNNLFSRANETTNSYLFEIDNFVDLEKVRILFFTCPDLNQNTKDYNNEDYIFDGTKPDYFLFESKSRWVSILDDKESSESQWQVTAPVFTYGNNDEYDWEAIRYALENYPFKIVLLVNRPDYVNFGNFDNKFKIVDPENNPQGIVEFKTDRGPNWGPKDTYIPEGRNADNIEWRNSDARRLDRDKFNYNGVDFTQKPTINGLHHCQWDAVYASKNTGDQSKDGNRSWGVYTFIMKNPYSYKNPNDLLIAPKEGDENDAIANTDLMGALSYWTTKLTPMKNGEEVNHYFHPNKSQGIPMYGVQVFDPLVNWNKGTPYNVSYRQHEQDGVYYRKNINLLRSLVKLELKIPKEMMVGGVKTPVTISQPYLMYSNVMARCEPLDVATPIERTFKSESVIGINERCEWFNLLEYGPIINTTNHAHDIEYLVGRYAWFYGAWKEWWDFNPDDTKFPINVDQYSNGLPYPRIYNPVIQRNKDPRIDDCLVEDEFYWYYVVYTGERNINDPSTFGDNTSMQLSKTEIPFFKFTLQHKEGSTTKSTTYCIALTDYTKNKLINNGCYRIGDADFNQSTNPTRTPYKIQMGENKNSDNWGWPLLRNHCYTFTVNSLGDYSDPGGIDVSVVSTENRYAPGFTFE